VSNAPPLSRAFILMVYARFGKHRGYFYILYIRRKPRSRAGSNLWEFCPKL